MMIIKRAEDYIFRSFRVDCDCGSELKVDRLDDITMRPRHPHLGVSCDFTVDCPVCDRGIRVDAERVPRNLRPKPKVV